MKQQTGALTRMEVQRARTQRTAQTQRVITVRPQTSSAVQTLQRSRIRGVCRCEPTPSAAAQIHFWLY